MADKSGQQDSPTEKRVQRRTRALRDACERRRNSRAFFWGGAKAQATAKNKRRRDARAAARDNPDPEAGQSVVRGAAVRKLARGQVKAVREEALAKERERKKKHM